VLLGRNKPRVVVPSAAKNVGVTGGMLHFVQHDRLWSYLRPDVLVIAHIWFQHVPPKGIALKAHCSITNRLNDEIHVDSWRSQG